MNTECLFTVCSRGREHEHLGEQLVNSAAASVEQDRVVLHVAAADVLVQCGRPRRRRSRRAEGRRLDFELAQSRDRLVGVWGLEEGHGAVHGTVTYCPTQQGYRYQH